MIYTIRPRLPTAEQLLPYLTRIDESGIYSNDGPLVRNLEQRLNGVAVSSATLGLELAAGAIFKKGKPVRVSALTYPATILAIMRAGLKPIICDVDETTWALADIDEHSVPTAPYGLLTAEMQKAPLIDAAGVNPFISVTGEDNATMVFSLHATKALPAGEGGLVRALQPIRGIVARDRNFGWDTTIKAIGTNAKMSEYHAAVALASIDEREVTFERRTEMERRYQNNLRGEITTQKRPAGVYSIFPILVDDGPAMARWLADNSIETKRWYLPLLNQHPAFSGVECESLKVAKKIARQLICLPFHLGLKNEDIDYICECIRSGLRLAA